MGTPLEVFYASEARTQTYQQISENSARNAAFTVTFTSTGDGEAVLTTPVVFDTVFTERPVVSTGTVLLRAADSKQFLLPRVEVGVYRWITQKAPGGSLYTGCYPYFVVDVPVIPDIILPDILASPNCIIEHHIRFDGISLKKLAPAIVDMPEIT